MNNNSNMKIIQYKTWNTWKKSLSENITFKKIVKHWVQRMGGENWITFVAHCERYNQDSIKTPLPTGEDTNNRKLKLPTSNPSPLGQCLQKVQCVHTRNQSLWQEVQSQLQDNLLCLTSASNCTGDWIRDQHKTFNPDIQLKIYRKNGEIIRTLNFRRHSKPGQWLGIEGRSLAAKNSLSLNDHRIDHTVCKSNPCPCFRYCELETLKHLFRNFGHFRKCSFEEENSVFFSKNRQWTGPWKQKHLTTTLTGWPYCTLWGHR